MCNSVWTGRRADGHIETVMSVATTAEIALTNDNQAARLKTNRSEWPFVTSTSIAADGIFSLPYSASLGFSGIMAPLRLKPQGIRLKLNLPCLLRILAALFD